MSCDVMDWPVETGDLTLSITQTSSFFYDSGIGTTTEFTIEKTWTRVGYNAAIKLALTSGVSICTLTVPDYSVVVTVDPCAPTAPTLHFGAWPDEELEVVGSGQTYDEDGPDGAPFDLTVHAPVSAEFVPAWDSQSRRHYTVLVPVMDGEDDITPLATVSVNAVTGTGVIAGREQEVVATAAGGDVAMVGTAELTWTPVGAGGGEYGITITWSQGTADMVHPVVASITPPTWDDWAEGSSYAQYAVVVFDGTSYEALESVSGLPEPDTSGAWKVFDVDDHIAAYAIRDGLRFAFLGNSTATLAIVTDSVRAYPVSEPGNRFSVTASVDGDFNVLASTSGQEAGGIGDTDTNTQTEGDDDFLSNTFNVTLHERVEGPVGFEELGTTFDLSIDGTLSFAAP